MKEKQYETMLAQLEGLIAGERNMMSVLSNASALMREVMGERYFWVGFYRYSTGLWILLPQVLC